MDDYHRLMGVSSIEDLDRLLSDGFDPNQESSDGKTAVFFCERIAASFDVLAYRRLIVLFKKHGACLNHCDFDGSTALLLSECDLFSLAMLQEGASICAGDPRLWFPKSCLISSAKKGHTQSIEYILKEVGDSVDRYVGRGTALHHCMYEPLLIEGDGSGIEAGMRALVENSLCLDAPDFLGRTPLSLVSDSVGCAAILLDKGANPNAKIPQGVWFHRRFFNGFVSGLFGIDDMDRVADGKLWETPIHGVHRCSPELIRLLLARGACVDSFDSDGNTALMRLLEDEEKIMSPRMLEVFNILLSFGASCTTLNNGGESVRDLPLAKNPHVSDRIEKRVRDENWVRRMPFFLVLNKYKSSEEDGCGVETECGVIKRLAAAKFVPSEGFLRDIVMFI